MTPRRVTCDSIIKACDKALAAKDTEIKAGNDALQVEETLNAGLKGKVDTDESKLNSPFRSPIVMVGLGLLAALISPVVGVVTLATVVVGTSL